MNKETREALTKGRIRLNQPSSDNDKEILAKTSIIIELRLDLIEQIFLTLFDVKLPVITQTKPALMHSLKAYLKFRRKNPTAILTQNEIQSFYEEIPKILSLFHENGISLNEIHIRTIMTYHGLEYWEEFFESEEFTPYKKSPSTVIYAIENSAIDPRKFLRDAKSKFDTLKADPAFTEITHLSWVFWKATLHYPKNSRKFLENILSNIQKIGSSPECRDFWESPWFTHIAATRKDPIKFLKGIKAKATAILAKDEFEMFRRKDGENRIDIVYQALAYQRDPENFLRKTKASTADIIAGGQYSDFSKEEIMRAVIHRPKNPKGCLDEVRSILKAALADQTLSFLHANPAAIRSVAFRHFHNTITVLHSAVSKMKTILEERANDPVKPPKSIVIVAVLKYSDAPNVFIDRHLEKAHKKIY